MSGTQAENTIDNHIVVSKMFNLCKTQFDDDPEEADDDTGDDNAKINYDTIPHRGAVNRIRVLFSIVSLFSVFLAVPRLWVSGLIKVLLAFTILPPNFRH